MTIFPLLVLVCLALTRCEGRTCPSCYRVKCQPVVGCQWGLTFDVCGCCQVCAKGLLERCGRAWATEGKCATGLACFYKDVQEHGACIGQSLMYVLQKLYVHISRNRL